MIGSGVFRGSGSRILREYVAKKPDMVGLFVDWVIYFNVLSGTTAPVHRQDWPPPLNPAARLDYVRASLGAHSGPALMAAYLAFSTPLLSEPKTAIEETLIRKALHCCAGPRHQRAGVISLSPIARVACRCTADLLFPVRGLLAEMTGPCCGCRSSVSLAGGLIRLAGREVP